MNLKRILFWFWFVVFIGLIIWGMIAANKKALHNDKSFPIPNEITSSDWIKGNASSSVTLLEYSDFQCPACYAYYPIVKKNVDENIDKIRFVYRHFPLSQHANAIPASLASEAAGKQGKFWEMYDMIFENHDSWENSTNVKTIFAGYAKDLGLDINKYAIDIDSKEVKDKVDNDTKGAIDAQINATPTFYINGIKIENPQGYEDFKKIINEALNKKS